MFAVMSISATRCTDMLDWRPGPRTIKVTEAAYLGQVDRCLPRRVAGPQHEHVLALRGACLRQRAGAVGSECHVRYLWQRSASSWPNVST